MGFCILGGKESYLRKTLSDLLTSLGQAVGIGATPSQFSTAINNIYTQRYTAGQDSLKVDRTLTLTSSQTGTSVDITDNWYTKVNASAVYSAGQDSQKKPNQGFVVFNLPSNQNGTSGISNGSTTKTIPAGTYKVLILFGCGGSLTTQTVTLTVAGSTRTYKCVLNSSGEATTLPSTGGGSYYGTGNPQYLAWQDSFTLSSASSVTLSVDTAGSNYRNRATIAAIY